MDIQKSKIVYLLFTFMMCASSLFPVRAQNETNKELLEAIQKSKDTIKAEPIRGEPTEDEKRSAEKRLRKAGEEAARAREETINRGIEAGMQILQQQLELNRQLEQRRLERLDAKEPLRVSSKVKIQSYQNDPRVVTTFTRPTRIGSPIVYTLVSDAAGMPAGLRVESPSGPDATITELFTRGDTGKWVRSDSTAEMEALFSPESQELDLDFTSESGNYFDEMKINPEGQNKQAWEEFLRGDRHLPPSQIEYLDPETKAEDRAQSVLKKNITSLSRMDRIFQSDKENGSCSNDARAPMRDCEPNGTQEKQLENTKESGSDDAKKFR